MIGKEEKEKLDTHDEDLLDSSTLYARERSPCLLKYVAFHNY
jgi:hypothetical protein